MSQEDRLVRMITADGCYRVVGVSTVHLVRELLGRHQARGVVALALARAVTAIALITTVEKSFSRVAVQWSGRGSLRTLHADARPGGKLRAYPGSNEVEESTLPEALGSGVVTVIEQDPSGRFTRGSLPFSSSEVDEDLEAYLCRSEQVPSRLRVLVDLDDEGRPLAVAGLLLQTLPGGASEALLDEDRGRLGDLVRRTLPASLAPEELARLVLPDAQLEQLATEPLLFECQCSQDRVERGVALLGAEELLEMITQNEEARVRCDFCSQDYVLGIDDLERLVQQLDPEG